ncbi:hypothetical protein [Streptomyces sp. NP-1717]|uniref:hypothetical protein n=1 Tax=Streptomyces sp. NP-1717 TaxID=2704470 RepID=UPI001F5C45D1|nr:hypothetical protein [Streptomyces sp. NP-1717]MCI3223073.1 hypothetical protein [Streptomyces sp. NP-1717]
MAMDYAARQQATRKVRGLLKERHNDGNDFVDPVRVMYAVRAAAYDSARAGEEAPEVPVDDVLAALTMLDEARARLDALNLLRAARSRDASWATVADALGLSARQSAESRALRLERSRCSPHARGWSRLPTVRETTPAYFACSPRPVDKLTSRQQ